MRTSQFPTPPAADGKVNLGLRVSEELADKMRELARSRRMLIGGVWEEAAEDFLRKQVGEVREG